MNFNHDIGSIDSILVIDTTVVPPLGGNTNSLQVLGTGSVYLPVGTTAQRPAAAGGQIRFNTTTNLVEYNDGTAWSTLSSSTGTVSSISITGSTGLGVSGSPITTSGTITLTLNSELQGLSGLSATGILTRTAGGTFASRTITGTASNISVTNGDGIAGNPTLDLINAGTPVTNSLVKITTDTKGRTTATTAVAAGDLTPLLDATYINASGDSMTAGANLTFIGGGEVLGLPVTPTTAGSAASKAYVDAKLEGLNPKGSARVATTTNGTLATAFAAGTTHDGVTLVIGDLLLIKNQTTQSENGLYVVTAGAPTRSASMDAWTEVPNAYLFIQEGTLQADTGWVCTSNAGGTLGTTAITFVQFAGAGSYTAGAGLTLTGTQFSLTSPVSLALGGTGITTTPANGQIDIGNGTGFVRTNITQGSGITITNGAGTITIANNGVTSLVGSSNQINASSSTGAITLSLPTTLVVPGSLGVTTSLTVSGLTANGVVTTGAGGLIVSTAATNGQLVIGSTGAAPVLGSLTAGAGISITPGAGSITIASTGVTSVGASGGTTGLSFTGSPITTSGTLTLSGTLVPASGGTGLTALGTANQVFGVNAAGTAGEYKSIVAGAGITVTPSANTLTIASTSTGVTSVALAAPSIFTVSGSPVTTTGTLTFTLNTQANNTIFAGPTTGGPLVPTFRTLTFADLSATAIKLYAENPSTPVAPTATGTNAKAFGSGAVASLDGQTAQAGGVFSGAGDAQTSVYVSRNTTTTAAVTELFLNGSTSTLVVPTNSLWTYSILVSGRRTDAVGGGAGYRVDGVIRRDTTVGSVAMIGTPSKVVLGETNAAWDVTVDADTITGSLRIRVTGEAAKTIRWVATTTTSEVRN